MTMSERITIKHTSMARHEVRGKADVYTFESLDAALEAVAALKAGRIVAVNAGNDFHQAERSSGTDDRVDSKDWCEGMTDAECMAAIHAPPKSRVDLIDGFASADFATSVRPQSRRRVVKRLNDGDTIDAERFVTERTVEGVWSRRIRSSTPRPTIRVMVNAAASCGVPSKNFARAAAAVLSVVRSAEDNGYAVEVWWSNVQSVSGVVTAMAVCLKRVEDAFDWSTLVGTCVGATFFRTVGFDLIDACCANNHGGGYGTPFKWQNTMGEFDIISPATFATDADAKAWVAEAVKVLDKEAAMAA